MIAAVLLAAALQFGPPAPLQQPEIRSVVTQTQISLTGNGDGYLVVWRDHRGVMGGRLDRDGRVLDREGILLGDGSYPRAIWTGSQYLVVRQSTTVLDQLLFNTVGRDGSVGPLRALVASAGTPIDLATNGQSVLLLFRSRALLVDFDLNVLRTIDLGYGVANTSVASDGEDYVFTAVAGPDVRAYHVARNGDFALTAREGEVPTDARIAYGGGRYMVTWGAFWGGATQTDRLRSMTLSRTGERLTAPRDTAILPHTAIGNVESRLAPRRVVWRGSDFAASFGVYYETQAQALFAVPVSAETTSAATPQPLLADDLADIASNGGGSVVALWLDKSRRQLVSGLLDPGHGIAESDAFAPARAVVSAARPSLADAGGAVLITWLEDGLVHARLGAATATLPSSTDPDVPPVVGNDVVWFIERGQPYRARRYTRDLQPIDAEGIPIGSNFIAASFRTAVAGDTLAFTYMQYGNATLEVGLLTGLSLTKVVAAPPSAFYDHSPAIVWTGGEFLLVWAHPLGPEPYQSSYGYPDDEIRAVRVSRAGVVLDVPPLVLGTSPRVTDSIRAVMSNGRAGLVWGTASGLRGTTFTPGSIGTIRSWSPARVAAEPDIAPRPDGFVVAWPSFGRIDYRTIDLDGNPDDDIRSFANNVVDRVALVTIGGTSVLAYTNETSEPMLGSWQRILLRSTAPARNRAVR